MSAMTIAVAANVVTLAPIQLLKFGLVTSTRPATTPLLRVPKNSSYDDFGFGKAKFPVPALEFLVLLATHVSFAASPECKSALGLLRST
jgi:hypothetical protein